MTISSEVLINLNDKFYKTESKDYINDYWTRKIKAFFDKALIEALAR